MNDIYYIIGTAYAGKSTMVKLLAEKHDGIACEENYHDRLVDDKLDKNEFPAFATPETFRTGVSSSAEHRKNMLPG